MVTKAGAWQGRRVLSAEHLPPSPAPVVLRDGRLVLRAPAETDVPAITAACQDRELHRWLSALPDPYSEDDARTFVAMQQEAWAADVADGQGRVFAITAAEDGRLLGMTGLHDLAELDHPSGGRGEIGYWIVAAERGSGVMTDAAKLVCAYGFEVLGLGRIEWQAETGNWPSRRVVDKLGFTFEGTCRGRLVHRSRVERVDGWLAGITRAEFETGVRPQPASPVIEHDGLRLRPWSLGDVADVLVLAEDAGSRRWSPSMREIHTLDDAAAWIIERTRPASWAVTDAASGALVGRVSLHHFAPDDRSAEIGYAVLPSWRQQGVATRAVSAVTAYGFAAPPEGLGLIRIALNHGVSNDASCAVAASTGYAFEGVQRQGINAPGGAFDDAHVHARLVTDPEPERGAG